MKTRAILFHTIVVSACTGGSRLLGLARDIIMASMFGTSIAQSAFVVAFRVPNLFRRLFGEGALSSSFVPVFSERIGGVGRDEAWRFASRMLTFTAALLGLLVAASMAGVSAALGSAGIGEKTRLTLELVRILMPYALFICLAALSMGILNSFHHFLLPAATPIILNAMWIAGLLLLCPLFGASEEQRIFGAAWAVLAAGVVQWAVQVPMWRRYGYRGQVCFGWFRDPNVRRVLLLALPAALGMGLNQINVMLDSVMALWVGKWAPAALSYAEHMIYLPQGLFATALGTVLLPVFSEQAARNGAADMRRTVGDTLRSLMFVMVPASVGLLVMATPIVQLAYERGAFTEQSTLLTARALQFYAPGLLIFSAHKIFVPAFYSLKDTRTPVRVGMCMMALNLALDVVSVLTWPTYYKHAGLAFSTVVGECGNSIILGWLLHRRIGSPGWRRVLRSGLAICGCAAAMAAAAWGAGRAADAAMAAAGAGALLRRGAVVAGGIGVGLAVYLALARVLCREELGGFVEAFRHRKERRADGEAAMGDGDGEP